MITVYTNKDGYTRNSVRVDPDGYVAIYDKTCVSPGLQGVEIVALDRHYQNGAPQGWQQNYVSSYATMHPAEDWAETFAHYLHIRDTLDTAAAFSFAPANATYERKVLGPSSFDAIIETSDRAATLTSHLLTFSRRQAH